MFPSLHLRWRMPVAGDGRGVRSQHLRQLRYSSVLEKCNQRNLYGEYLAQARKKLGRNQRIAAQFKKIIVNANLSDAQETSPQFADSFLSFICRRYIGSTQSRPAIGRIQFTSLHRSWPQ